jgi:superfamily II DNA helicase RecQ
MVTVQEIPMSDLFTTQATLPPIRCTICNIEFAKKGQLTMHVKNVHQQIVQIKLPNMTTYTSFQRSQDQKFVCSRCEIRLSTPKELRNHVIECFTQQASMLSAIVDDPLSRVNLCYNQELKLMICTICETGLVPRFINSHLKNQHSFSTPIDTSLYQLSDPLELIPPTRQVPGIKVYSNGWKCLECIAYFTPKKATFKSHFHRKHPSIKRYPNKIARIQEPLQTLFRVKEFKKFFPIHCTNSTTTRDADLQREMARVLDRNVHVNDFRNTSHWVSLMQWGELVSGYDRTLLFRLCELQDNLGDKILNAVYSYLQVANNNIRSKGNITILRKISSTVPGVLAEHPFGPLCEEGSLRSYSMLFSRLILSMIRSMFVEEYQGCYPELNEGLVSELSGFYAILTSINEIGRDQVHRVALAIWCNEYAFARNANWEDPVYRFMCYSSINANGTFSEANQVTAISARLEFWARITIHEEILTIRIDGDGAKIRLNQFLFYIHEGEFTGFNNVLEVMHAATSVAFEKPIPPKFTWIPGSNYHGMIFNGQEIYISTIADVVRKELSTANALICELLNGMPVDIPNIIEDSLAICTPGYSFLQNFRNKRTHLLEHLKGRMLISQINESFIWNMERVNIWLGKVSELVECIFVLIHLSSGMPARATEHETCKPSNDQDDQRSIYISMDTLMLFNRYWKGRVRGGDRIVSRYLPKQVANIIVTFLVYIKPVEIYFCENETSGTNYLFTRNGQRLDADDLCTVFKKRFLQASGKSITFADYRHIAQAFANELLAKGNNPFVVFDHQFAHSTTTASRFYAKSRSEHPNLDRNQHYDFFMASLHWHTLLGLFWHPHQQKPTTTTISPLSLTPLPHASTTWNTGPNITVIVPSSDTLSSAKRDRKCKSNTNMPALLCGLKKYYNNPEATFKSKEQAKITSLVYERKSDVLAILPTGGGKTLTVLLPVFLEHDLITIFITPLRVLVEEMLERGASLDAIVWTNDLTASETRNRLIICSVENAVCIKLWEFAQELNASKRLARIVLDECHTALTWSRFRKVFKEFPLPRTIPVPFVMLTATLPVKLESKLRKKLITNPKISRSTTTRPEISYTVCTTGNIFDLVNEHLLDTRDRAIIYFRTKRELESVYDPELTARYHGDTTDGEVQRGNWISGRVKIMLATSAFALGVDYPHVRIVIHYGAPSSIMDYAQESGRAGRDGGPAKAIILNTGSRVKSTKLVGRYIKNRETCRREIIQVELDSVGGQDCISTNSNFCDICQNQISNQVPSSTFTAASLSAEEIDLLVCAEIAKDIVKEETLFIHEFYELLKQYSNRCIICAAMGITAVHELTGCKKLEYHCVRCMLRGHMSDRCPVPRNIPYENGGCYKCGLPRSAYNQKFHIDDEYGHTCSSPANDRLLPLAWYVYRHYPHLLETKMNESAYAVWLTQSKRGLPNSAHVFIAFFQKKNK